MSQKPGENTGGWWRRSCVWAAMFAAVALLACVLVKRQATPAFADDPNLVRTSFSSPSLVSPSMSWPVRMIWKLNEYRMWRHANPGTWTFGASGTNRCSIHGLLNQCMQAGGTQYLIEKAVAGGSVVFGHTNALNGREWIAAFENALRNGTPEWWDAKKQGFRHENLVLLRWDERTALLLSTETAREYQARFPRLRPY